MGLNNLKRIQFDFVSMYRPRCIINTQLLYDYWLGIRVKYGLLDLKVQMLNVGQIRRMRITFLSEPVELTFVWLDFFVCKNCIERIFKRV